jgi:hypothetical protein
MEALGENLEILDNLSPKTQSTNTELIPSVIAKQRIADDFLADESNQSPLIRCPSCKNFRLRHRPKIS